MKKITYTYIRIAKILKMQKLKTATENSYLELSKFNLSKWVYTEDLSNTNTVATWCKSSHCQFAYSWSGLSSGKPLFTKAYGSPISHNLHISVQYYVTSTTTF